MKTILFALCMVVSVLSYAADKPKAPSGSFGTCSCNGNNRIIELVLNEDATFKYTDNSDPSHAKVITGTWIMKSEKMLLTASDGNKTFHRKWKYTKDGKCIKSRYKMNFMRICVLTSCK
jgi:hypothetical protein